MIADGTRSRGKPSASSARGATGTCKRPSAPPLAFHQSCLSHLLKRCREMAQVASPAAAAFPLAVRHLLRTSLELRDRYAQGEISGHGLRSAAGRVEAKLDRMLDIRYWNPANQRLARHLAHERLWLFRATESC